VVTPQGWYSPLHLACKRGDADLIWLLLDRGAKWTAVDKVGRKGCRFE
jgi:hypothetical protein